ncbi:glutathione S-transferase [Marinicella sp. W31]|uniref:glutathione S-transferase n=1 Tax=Marinicella sp. W31 TaxID=3023713 RepID=UPI0037563843
MAANTILYSFRRCPYAIRARMALVAADIQVELRELILKDKPSCMLQHSPKGTVPVLVLPDNRVIDESLEVMLWALQQNDPNGWLTHSNESTSQALIEHNDGDFKQWLDRYKYADRHPEYSVDYYQDQVLNTLKALNDRLKHSVYLINDKPRLADIAVFPFIRQCAFVDKAWFDALPLTGLQRWLNTLLDSEYFTRSMPKFTLFNQGFSHIFPA